MSAAIFSLVAASVLVGATVQSITGYGYAILALPLLALAVPLQAPQLLALLGVPLVVAMALIERMHVNVRAVTVISAGRIVGTSAAILLLAGLDTLAIRLVFAVAIAVSAIAMLLVRRPISQGLVARLVAGTFSGLMGTAAGIGGPPLAVLYAGREGPGSRATLSIVYALGSAITLGGFVLDHKITVADLSLASELLPALIAGLWLGRSRIIAVKSGRIRVLVQATMWLSAARLLVLALLSS